jgi:hypothetical protein
MFMVEEKNEQKKTYKMPEVKILGNVKEITKATEVSGEYWDCTYARSAPQLSCP